jgi:hypothetical protein
MVYLNYVLDSCCCLLEELQPLLLVLSLTEHESISASLTLVILHINIAEFFVILGPLLPDTLPTMS